MTDSARTYDVVVYGATGFVGRLLAGYLAEHAPPEARIALAGRSRERLQEVRDSLPQAAQAWAVLTADSSDRPALDSLAASTRVLATTVGPYARYGMPVVEACAQAGITPQEIDHYILHQANMRILEAVSKRLGLPEGRMLHNISKYGNTSAASIPLVLGEAVENMAGSVTSSTK